MFWCDRMAFTSMSRSQRDSCTPWLILLTWSCIRLTLHQALRSGWKQTQTMTMLVLCSDLARNQKRFISWKLGSMVAKWGLKGWLMCLLWWVRASEIITAKLLWGTWSLIDRMRRLRSLASLQGLYLATITDLMNCKMSLTLFKKSHHQNQPL